MDTIVTPVTVITLDSTRIVHSIKADLVARYFPPVVRLVQYDMSLPVIAVSLMQNGQTYTLPSGAAANIRVHKPDSTYVYNSALGCDSTRNIVYFEVTQAMAAANGDGLAIVEIVVDGDIAGTSLITLHFEENPVPEDAIESSDEWETIYELGERIIASTVTPVSTAAGMTDHDVVYLYTGTESGWNQGHMYYYNGTTWVDAGIAVTDTTLSVAGLAADAKKTGDEIADLKDGFDDLKEELYNTLVTDTASGAIASFPDGADSVPVKNLKVAIEPVQSGSGDPSPDNVRPISGHTQAVVTRCGKNLLKFTKSPQTTNGITFTPNADGSFSISGTASANAYFNIYSWTNVDSVGLPIQTPLAISGGTSDVRFTVSYRNPDGTGVVNGYDDGSGVRLTIPAHTNQIYIALRVVSGVTVDTTVYPMIRPESDTDATYEPYSGQTVTIDLDGTRYGGTLDVTTGVLTVNRVLMTINSTTPFLAKGGRTDSDEYYRPVNDGYLFGGTARYVPTSDGIEKGMICNMAPFKAPSTIDGTEYSAYVGENGTRLQLRLRFPLSMEINTIEKANEYAASNNIQMIYPLATPVTVQLTPQEIKTLLGQNNIWSDCGDTEVEYRADTKLYINKMLNA